MANRKRLRTPNNLIRKVKAVVVDGPFPKQGRTGDEVPCWTVTLADDEGDAIKVYEHNYHSQALSSGRQIARDRRAELIIESRNA